ncbi:SMI1/KNR4 family protein [Streptomyces camelliae]|uniref:SMI1/KNR4 family protein n=1 Tax=Streptomyces camelliae TaxID=3004093 RepID=A0ABY7PH90_9ACTN|nr:SMI1/KNR4 family protein [Streptomyces sp. HUAS 2-6]WBO69057.1 SMI1/KNR4 family protein [Streptomyces sp. HUAS 2-6]
MGQVRAGRAAAGVLCDGVSGAAVRVCAMTQMFDVRQGLEHARADREAAWRFVRDFAHAWVEPLTEGDGFTEEDLAAAAERLGVSLPSALGEMYRLLGRRRDLTSNHDRLLHPDQLYIDARSEALVFREENQGACSWGVLLKDLDRADPGVHVLSDLADRQAQRWEPWMERLSWMAVEMVLAESLHAPQHLSDFLYEPDHEYTRVLEECCELLPFPSYPAAGFEGTRWFLGADVLLRDEEGCVPVRARTEEALDAVRALLPGDWLNA